MAEEEGLLPGIGMEEVCHSFVEDRRRERLRKGTGKGIDHAAQGGVFATTVRS